MKKRILDTIRDQKGVTLIEVVIYISVLSVVSVGIISIISQLITMKHTSDSYGIIVSEVNNVFEKIIYDIKESDMVSVVDNHTIQVTHNGETNEFRLENNSIVFVDDTGSYQLTTNLVQVEDVTFEDWTSTNSDDLIHIDLILKRGSISETFQTGIHIR